MRTDAGAVAGADPRVVGALRRAPIVMGTCVAGLGALVLLGWLLKLQVLTTFGASLSSMKANTALGFVALGLALRSSMTQTPKARRARNVLAGLGGALGASALVEYALGVELGVDELVLRDPWSVSLPGRMSSAMALNFVLLTGALLLTDDRARRFGRPAEWLALLAGVSSLLALL